MFLHQRMPCSLPSRNWVRTKLGTVSIVPKGNARWEAAIRFIREKKFWSALADDFRTFVLCDHPLDPQVIEIMAKDL